MAMVHLTIDGVPVSVEEGTTVLKAAHAAGIKIPTLCWLKDINEIGACRMCVVDVGARSLAAACVMPVSEGMVVRTNTPQVRQARKAVLELILSNHERKCLSCVRSQNCELQDLAKELGVDEKTAAEDACKAEHILSEQTLEKIRERAIETDAELGKTVK